jgi:MFS family permease
VIAGTAELVTRLVPEHSRGAALGWHGAALTTGGAVGAPLAGAAIDLSGPGAGFLVVAGVGVAVAGVGLVVRSVRTRGG